MSTREIREACKKLEITADDVLILGGGSSRINGYYRQSISSDKLKKLGLKFAVQYCKDLKVFIAWNLQRSELPTRTKLSVKAVDVENNLGDGIGLIGKHVEYSGWNEENVLVFKPNLIEDFLIKYVK